MNILSIETSCDETACAVTSGRKVLSHTVYSQILLHKKWGGVVPSIAKRAHEEKIDFVIQQTLLNLQRHSGTAQRHSRSNRESTLTRFPIKLGMTNRHSGVSERHDRILRCLRSYRSLWLLQDDKEMFTSEVDHTPGVIAVLNQRGHPRGERYHPQGVINVIDFVAVTYGPGLAIALEVGINKAKEIAKDFNKKIIPVNHMEGHIYSAFIQNKNGNPDIKFKFPYLVLVVSGGHTEIVLWKDHNKYEMLGETLDDAAGEALDKAAKMLGLGYPGGEIIEKLAKKVENKDIYKFPRPMIGSHDLNFSFSGLKTSMFYLLKKISEKEQIKSLNYLASSYQEAVFNTILFKIKKAQLKYKVNNLIVVGGVTANQRLRLLIRKFVRQNKINVLFPSFKKYCTDNAAMIGVAASYKIDKAIGLKGFEKLDRVPRLKIE
jgi:N6-L-threonylcarbamoyladenine synthase